MSTWERWVDGMHRLVQSTPPFIRWQERNFSPCTESHAKYTHVRKDVVVMLLQRYRALSFHSLPLTTSINSSLRATQSSPLKWLCVRFGLPINYIRQHPTKPRRAVEANYCYFSYYRVSRPQEKKRGRTAMRYGLLWLNYNGPFRPSLRTTTITTTAANAKGCAS